MCTYTFCIKILSHAKFQFVRHLKEKNYYIER